MRLFTSFHVRGFVFCFLSGLLLITACAPTPITRSGYPVGHVERGVASWYGPGFHGKQTANGERYDMYQLTAAHKTLPMGSVVEVKSFSTGRTVTVRINDRGPFVKGRIIDLSYKAAKALDMVDNGTAHVEIRVSKFTGKSTRMGSLWVQVGSFNTHAHAVGLVRKLERRYRDVRIVSVELPTGKWYRVQIGRFSSEKKARTVADELEGEFGVNPFLVREG